MILKGDVLDIKFFYDKRVGPDLQPDVFCVMARKTVGFWTDHLMARKTVGFWTEAWNPSKSARPQGPKRNPPPKGIKQP